MSFEHRPGSSSRPKIKCVLFKDYQSFSLTYSIERAGGYGSSDESMFQLHWHEEGGKDDALGQGRRLEFSLKLPKNSTNVKVFKSGKNESLVQSVLSEKTLINDPKITIFSDAGSYSLNEMDHDGGSRANENPNDEGVTASMGNIVYLSGDEIVTKNEKDSYRIKYPNFLIKGIESKDRTLKFCIEGDDENDDDGKTSATPGGNDIFSVRVEFGLVYNPSVDEYLENYVGFCPNRVKYDDGLVLDEMLKKRILQGNDAESKACWYSWHFLNLDSEPNRRYTRLLALIDDSKPERKRGVCASTLNTYVTVNPNENLKSESLVLPNDSTTMLLRREKYLDDKAIDLQMGFYGLIASNAAGPLDPGGGGGGRDRRLYATLRSATMEIDRVSAVSSEETGSSPPVRGGGGGGETERNTIGKKKKQYGLTLKPNPKYLLSSKHKIDYVLSKTNVETLIANVVHVDNSRMEVGRCAYENPRRVVFLKGLEEIRKGECRVRDEYGDEITAGSGNRVRINNETKYLIMNELSNLKLKACLTNSKRTAEKEGGSLTEIRKYTMSGVRLTSVGESGQRTSESDDATENDASDGYDELNPWSTFLFVFTDAKSVIVRDTYAETGEEKRPSASKKGTNAYETMEKYTETIRGSTANDFSDRYPHWNGFKKNLESFLSEQYNWYPTNLVMVPVVLRKKSPVGLEFVVEKFVYR